MADSAHPEPVPTTHAWLVGVWKLDTMAVREAIIVLQDGRFFTCTAPYHSGGDSGCAPCRQTTALAGAVVLYGEDYIEYSVGSPNSCCGACCAGGIGLQRLQFASHSADQFSVRYRNKYGFQTGTYKRIAGESYDSVKCPRCQQPLRPERRYECGLGTTCWFFPFWGICIGPMMRAQGSDHVLVCAECGVRIVDFW